MKTIRITACVLLAVVLLTAMVSCGGGASLVGTWVAEEDGMEVTMEFNSDGTGKMGAMGVNMDMTYKVDGDKLNVTVSMMGMEQTTEFTYKVEGNKLSLTADGVTQEFTKK